MKTYENEFFIVYNATESQLPIGYFETLSNIAGYLGVNILYLNKITSDFRNKNKTHVKVRNHDIMISKFKETTNGNVIKVW